MKHLKKFESYSINEEEGIFGKARSFVSGHESKADHQTAKNAFLSELEKFEKEAEGDDDVAFNKAGLLKKAEDNNFLGNLEYRRSRGDGRNHVFYVKTPTGLETLASNAAGKRDNPLN